MGGDPKTLQDAILYFADPANCREYLMARRLVQRGQVTPFGQKRQGRLPGEVQSLAVHQESPVGSRSSLWRRGFNPPRIRTGTEVRGVSNLGQSSAR